MAVLGRFLFASLNFGGIDLRRLCLRRTAGVDDGMVILGQLLQISRRG